MGKYNVAGDNVTITCKVDYRGPDTPYIEWSDDNDEVVIGATEWIETDNETYPDYEISVRVSELDVFVPEDAEQLPPYTCTVRFFSHIRDLYYYYAYTPYNWTSPHINVSCK